MSNVRARACDERMREAAILLADLTEQRHMAEDAVTAEILLRKQQLHNNRQVMILPGSKCCTIGTSHLVQGATAAQQQPSSICPGSKCCTTGTSHLVQGATAAQQQASRFCSGSKCCTTGTSHLFQGATAAQQQASHIMCRKQKLHNRRVTAADTSVSQTS